MPIYEYRCAACRRRTSVFVRSVSSPVRARCEHCGGRKLTRLLSKFAVHRAAPGFDDDGGGIEDIDEDDPRAVARWARRMRDETGEDMGPEFDEMVGRMERGESPEEIMAGEDVDFDGGGDDGDL
jgi:putative FmdB family regulatory protein